MLNNIRLCSIPLSDFLRSNSYIICLLESFDSIRISFYLFTNSSSLSERSINCGNCVSISASLSLSAFSNSLNFFNGLSRATFKSIKLSISISFSVSFSSISSASCKSNCFIFSNTDFFINRSS